MVVNDAFKTDSFLVLQNKKKAYTCNPSTSETEAGGLPVPGELRLYKTLFFAPPKDIKQSIDAFKIF